MVKTRFWKQQFIIDQVEVCDLMDGMLDLRSKGLMFDSL